MPREHMLIKIYESQVKVKITDSNAENEHVCVCAFLCVWVGGLIEINGVRSEGDIRTMEGSKEGGEREGERQRWSAWPPLSRV